MWQHFATPAAALRYIKSEGAPSNLQQVQIERAAKNVAADVRTEEAKLLFQAPYFALTSDSCTDWSTKKEEMLYVRYPLPNHVVTHFFSIQPLEGGGAKSILRAYKAAFEQAAIPLEVWVRRLV